MENLAEGVEQHAPKSDSVETFTDITNSSASVDDTESFSVTDSSITDKSASVQRYEDEWAQLYLNPDEAWGELRRRAVTGHLRASRFRSVCWRALLGVLPQKTSLWISELKEQRQRYRNLKHELCSDPRIHKKADDDPLSQSKQSVWHQHFCDQELCGVIKQDVVRTFPGVDFFRKDTIQEIMISILFCYAREHPSMCYRQGMHEILAPLLFVLHCDHQVFLHAREQFDINDIIGDILNPEYLEEDAFTLFTQIMSGIESCYRINDLTPTETGYFPVSLSPKTNSPDSQKPENEVVAQLNWIRDHLLASFDPVLNQYLIDLDIPLPLFGIRWLRLLFGREFPLQDLLVLWDAIFAEGENFELVNYIVVAMLIAIRNQLLSGDYTTCLTFLMRYPGAVDITYIIEHALHLMHPKKYSVPATIPFLPQAIFNEHSQRNKSANKTYMKKTKLPDAEGESLASNLKKKAASNITTSRTSVRYAAGHGQSDIGVVDGYTLDDPELLRVELQHAHSIMSLTRMKLLKYLTILRTNTQPTCSHDIVQALDGIQELCSLLKLRQNNLSYVEPALEADENQTKASPIRRTVNPPTNLSLKTNLSEQQIRNNRYVKPQTPAKKLPNQMEVAMKVFRQKGSGQIMGAPSIDPLGHRAEDD